MSIGSVVPLADTWGMHGDIGTGWWIVMVVGMVVFWGAVIVGAAWLLRAGSDGGHQQRSESPQDILERRLAEGAISVDEYHERRKLLETGTPPSEAADMNQQGSAA